MSKYPDTQIPVHGCASSPRTPKKRQTTSPKRWPREFELGYLGTWVFRTLVIALLLICAAAPAQEFRRRGTGDMVGDLAHQLRESMNDLMDRLLVSAPPQSFGDPEVKAILAVGKVEGQLAVLAALARNGRSQPYAQVMEELNRSVTEADQCLRAWRSAGMAMAQWFHIQMDLRQLDMNVRRTAPGR